jgi:hypothetical protein
MRNVNERAILALKITLKGPSMEDTGVRETSLERPCSLSSSASPYPSFFTSDDDSWSGYGGITRRRSRMRKDNSSSKLLNRLRNHPSLHSNSLLGIRGCSHLLLTLLGVIGSCYHDMW